MVFGRMDLYTLLWMPTKYDMGRKPPAQFDLLNNACSKLVKPAQLCRIQAKSRYKLVWWVHAVKQSLTHDCTYLLYHGYR